MRSRIKRPKALPTLLELTNIFGPSINPSLTFNIPSTRISINKQIFPEIQQMKYTAAHYRLAYLTANQVESFYRVFILNKLVTPDDKNKLNTNASYNNPQDYQTFINPEIIGTKGQQEKEENCLTFPFLKFKVQRHQQIRLKFKDQRKELKEQNYTGFVAQLIQHCINHLNGELLLDYQLSHGKFSVQKDMVLYLPKTNFLLKEYSLRLKDYHSQTTKTEEDRQKFEAMKKDYIERLQNIYSAESQQFSKKMTDKKIQIF